MTTKQNTANTEETNEPEVVSETEKVSKPEEVNEESKGWLDTVKQKWSKLFGA